MGSDGIIHVTYTISPEVLNSGGHLFARKVGDSRWEVTTETLPGDAKDKDFALKHNIPPDVLKKIEEQATVDKMRGAQQVIRVLHLQQGETELGRLAKLRRAVHDFFAPLLGHVKERDFDETLYAWCKEKINTPEYPGRVKAARLIRTAYHHKREELNIENLGLTSLPATAMGALHCKLLRLGGNQLTELPDTLARIKELEEVDLHENPLTIFPDVFTHCKALRSINVRGTQVTAVPLGDKRVIISYAETPLSVQVQATQRKSLSERGAKAEATAKAAAFEKLREEIKDKGSLAERGALLTWCAEALRTDEYVAREKAVRRMLLSSALSPKELSEKAAEEAKERVRTAPRRGKQREEALGHLKEAIREKYAAIKDDKSLSLKGFGLTSLPLVLPSLGWTSIDLSGNQLKDYPGVLFQMDLQRVNLTGNPCVEGVDQDDFINYVNLQRARSPKRHALRIEGLPFHAEFPAGPQ